MRFSLLRGVPVKNNPEPPPSKTDPKLETLQRKSGISLSLSQNSFKD